METKLILSDHRMAMSHLCAVAVKDTCNPKLYQKNASCRDKEVLKLLYEEALVRSHLEQFA